MRTWSVRQTSAARRRALPLRGVRVWLVVLAVLATVLVVPKPSAPVARAFPGGVTGARLWLRADQSVTATLGGAVLVWGDVSGSGTVTTQATTPFGGVTLVPSAVNFNPTVRFAGGPQHYMVGDTSQNFSTAATIFVVATPRPKATSLQGLVQPGHQGIYYDGNADRAIVEGILADQSNSANTVDPLADRWSILRGSYTNGGTTSGTSIAVQGRLNENFTGFGADLDSESNFEIGRTPGNPSDRTFGGDIAETLYFPRVLTGGREQPRRELPRVEVRSHPERSHDSWHTCQLHEQHRHGRLVGRRQPHLSPRRGRHRARRYGSRPAGLELDQPRSAAGDRQRHL